MNDILERVYRSENSFSSCSEQTMEDQDILLQLCSRMDNPSLEKLSHTPLWNIIRVFSEDQYFWYLRVQHLLRRELKQRAGEDWKRTYYYYSQVISVPTSLSMLIQLELGQDPSLDDNKFIKLASLYGYHTVVKLILRDKRIDPSVKNNYCINHASVNGHEKVVELLLQDKRIDSSQDLNPAIKHASMEGHEKVVELLIQDKRVDSSQGLGPAILYASMNGHEKVVELLLRDNRTDPSIDNDISLKYASQGGYLGVVRLLLRDKRVGSGESVQISIDNAHYRGHTEVIDLLLKKRGGSDPRALRSGALIFTGLALLVCGLQILS